MKGEKDVVEQDQSPESAVLQCTQGAAGHSQRGSRRRRGVVGGVEQDQSLPSAVLQGML